MAGESFNQLPAVTGDVTLDDLLPVDDVAGHSSGDPTTCGPTVAAVLKPGSMSGRIVVKANAEFKVPAAHSVWENVTLFASGGSGGSPVAIGANGENAYGITPDFANNGLKMSRLGFYRARVHIGCVVVAAGAQTMRFRLARGLLGAPTGLTTDDANTRLSLLAATTLPHAILLEAEIECTEVNQYVTLQAYADGAIPSGGFAFASGFFSLEWVRPPAA